MPARIHTAFIDMLSAFSGSSPDRLYLDLQQLKCAIQDSENSAYVASVPGCQNGMAIALDSRRIESAGCFFVSAFERWQRGSERIPRRRREHLGRPAMCEWPDLASIR